MSEVGWQWQEPGERSRVADGGGEGAGGLARLMVKHRHVDACVMGSIGGVIHGESNKQGWMTCGWLLFVAKGLIPRTMTSQSGEQDDYVTPAAETGVISIHGIRSLGAAYKRTAAHH
jgi:hypothetical protein